MCLRISARCSVWSLIKPSPVVSEVMLPEENADKRIIQTVTDHSSSHGSRMGKAILQIRKKRKEKNIELIMSIRLRTITTSSHHRHNVKLNVFRTVLCLNCNLLVTFSTSVTGHITVHRLLVWLILLVHTPQISAQHQIKV